MLTPVLVTLLSAAPVDVVAVWGPDAAAGLAKWTEPKRTRVDASGLYGALMHPDGMMPMQDFGTFRAAPFPGWPAELTDTWTSGLAYCRALVGPPPWRKVFATAAGCGNRLSQHLWQRLARHHHAERVIELESLVDPQARSCRVTARRWAPGSGEVFVFDRSGSDTEVRALVDLAVDALRTGKDLVKKPLDEFPELARPLSSDPWEKEPALTGPAVKLEKACPTGPKTLTFKSPSPLAASLAARWAPAEATGPAVPCELTFAEHDETMLGARFAVVTSTVTCAGAVAAMELSKQRAAKKPPLETLTETLAQLLAVQLCR